MKDKVNKNGRRQSQKRRKICKELRQIAKRKDRAQAKQSGYYRIGRVKWNGARLGHGVYVEYSEPEIPNKSPNELRSSFMSEYVLFERRVLTKQK